MTSCQEKETGPIYNSALVVFQGHESSNLNLKNVIPSDMALIELPPKIRTREESELEINYIVRQNPQFAKNIITYGENSGGWSAWAAGNNPNVIGVIVSDTWYNLENSLVPNRVPNTREISKILEIPGEAQLREYLSSIVKSKYVENSYILEMAKYSPSSYCSSYYRNQIPILVINHTNNSVYDLNQSLGFLSCMPRSIVFAPAANNQCGSISTEKMVQTWLYGESPGDCLSISPKIGINPRKIVPTNDRSINFRLNFSKDKNLVFTPLEVLNSPGTFVSASELTVKGSFGHVLYAYPAIVRSNQSYVTPITSTVIPIRTNEGNKVNVFPLTGFELNGGDTVGIVFATYDINGNFPESPLLRDIQISGNFKYALEGVYEKSL